MNLSQEELAERVYVTRQTVSNWENNKNYPDIHSLLLLSSVFHVSLDQLIKGDVSIMREEINKSELQRFNRDGAVYSILLFASVVSAVPLSVFLGWYGLIITAVLFAVALYFAVRLENYKKTKDIQTFKEIVSFCEGRRLDEIEKAQEYGKRPYQKLLLALGCGLISFAICVFFVWLLKAYIF
ncbi:MAG: helix-turn-helix domain-containing protein [Roseburia sp.]|nr:helix-turn-helix domain-containing protein [Roseburia sp.]